MKLEKCPNNHYYDADKFGTCPHCTGASGSIDETVALSRDSRVDMSTISIAHAEVATPNDGWNEIVEDEKDVTVNYGKKLGGTVEPVVGWLVCLNGKNLGKDYRLKIGRNYIGRADNMDVAIKGENTVSRDKHAIIVYDPKQNVFLAQPGDSKVLSYLNNELVITVSQLNAYDKLQIGDVELLFIPCCSDLFKWSEAGEEGKEK